MTSKRRPHFRRVKSPPVRITDDDIAIIRHVARHRLRRSTDLTRLLAPRSPKKIVERLTTLYHSGYLDRPDAQRDYFTAGKRVPYIYALGNRGADLLHAIEGTDPPKVDWTDKNRDMSRRYFRHRLMIGDIASAVERISKHHPSVLVLHKNEILSRAPQAVRDEPSPWTWRAKTPTTNGGLQDTKTIPDYVFGLDFTEHRRRYYFLVEADRATMPVLRNTPSQTSIGRKLTSYFHGLRGCYHHRYGIGNVKFLTVTTTQQRVRSMISAVHKITNGQHSDSFLFTTIEQVHTSDDLLLVEWQSAHSATTTLHPER